MLYTFHILIQYKFEVFFGKGFGSKLLNAVLHVMCLGSPYHMVLELMLKLCLDNFLMTSLPSLVYMYYFDNPGGMIPSWLVNWAAKVSKA